MCVEDRRSLAESLGRFGMLAVAVLVIGLLAGITYGRSQPRAAAGAVIADFVEVTDSTGNERAPAAPDPVAPSSGNHDGEIRCGVVDKVISNDDHLESLAAGVVVVRYQPGIDADDLATLINYARRGGILVAPEPRLEVPIMAVAWAHRMPLGDPNRELLNAFHTARVGVAPDPVENVCPPA